MVFTEELLPGGMTETSIAGKQRKDKKVGGSSFIYSGSSRCQFLLL